MPKIGILIPCYNVQNSIAKVLSSFSADILAQIDAIVAIDNDSEDKTLEILKSIQVQNNVLGQKLIIIKNLSNYGLGGSQKIGYQYFLDRGFSHFFIIHGDGQGNGREIAGGFLDIFRRCPWIDLILTSRFVKGANTRNYDRSRVIGNHVFNGITFLCTGHLMTDSGAGIIFVRTKVLERVPFWDLTNSFQFNPELNIFFHSLKDLKVIEMPMRWSDSKDRSNISALNYCFTLLNILVRYRFNKTVLRRKGHQLFHPQSGKFNPRFEILVR